jgi:hypothetical protein
MKTKLFPFLALMLIIGAFLWAGITTAYADAAPPDTAETLAVDEVWLTGDILHIAVTNKITNDKQKLELVLSDYTKNTDELVTIQAVDNSGNASNFIQFRNPYYAPNTADTPEKSGSESSVPDSPKPIAVANPFTPDGTGAVIDNATDGDGKEFFTVETADGNMFYLIVDRERTADNVYLLNAVTEEDLASLAKPGNGKSESAIPAPVTPAPEASPEPPTPPAPEKNTNTGTIVFLVVALAAFSGAGYYIKIVRPKKNSPSAGDYEDEQEDDNEEMNLDNNEESEDDKE